VTRVNVVENDTGSTDGLGNPSHSVTCVVEGGVTLAVATAIFNNRGIGVLTNGDVSGSPVGGTQSVAVTDPDSGIVTDIGFIQPPSYIPIYVIVNAHLLPGGTSALLTEMAALLETYLNSLQIGELVTYGALFSVAMSVNPSLLTPVVSVHTLFFGASASPSTTTDVPIAFYEVAQGISANITVNSV
jgi:hypothetical protein